MTGRVERGEGLVSWEAFLKGTSHPKPVFLRFLKLAWGKKGSAHNIWFHLN